MNTMNMGMIFCSALFLVVLCEGAGRMLLRMLQIDTDDFAAPAGVAVAFCMLEMFYAPVMLMHGSFSRIILVTCLVCVIIAIGFVLNIRSCLRCLFRGRMIYVLLSGLLFMGIFACCQGKLQPQLNDELNLMASNLNAASVSMPGSSLQGYSLFGSFVMGLCLKDANSANLLLGVFAQMITAMLILDIVDSFKIGNPWFRFTLILAALFYYQFYSWKIIGAFNSGNWRIFFVAMVLYALYQWISTEKDKVKHLVIFSIGAGLFVHSGFQLISVEIIYCLGAWMFGSKKIRCLSDLLLLLVPSVIYFSLTVLNEHFAAGMCLLIGYIVLCVMRYNRKVYHHLIAVENVLIEHSSLLLYVLVPGVFLIGTFMMRFLIDADGFSYGAYLDFFSSSYLRSYLFLRRSLSDYVLDVYRWIGLFIFIVRANRREEKMMQHIFLGMVVFFINPLCLGVLTRITDMTNCAYAFEILFNPFTDVMIFYWIYTQFEWTVVGQWILELSLIGCVVFGHLTSFTAGNGSLYGDLLDADHIVEVYLP